MANVQIKPHVGILMTKAVGVFNHLTICGLCAFRGRRIQLIPLVYYYKSRMEKLRNCNLEYRRENPLSFIKYIRAASTRTCHIYLAISAFPKIYYFKQFFEKWIIMKHMITLSYKQLKQ